MHATWTWKSQVESTPHSESADGTMTLVHGNTPWANSPSVANHIEGETSVAALSKKRPGAFGVLAQSPVISLGLLFWHWLSAHWTKNMSVAERPAMRTLSHLALGGRKTITLVEVDGLRYLIGGGADTVTAIVAVQTDAAAASSVSGEDA